MSQHFALQFYSSHAISECTECVESIPVLEIKFPFNVPES
jgi:hypothetical protein